ncbi:glycosyltransferase family 2 protein [Achromobacter xylosoxidans]|uniref:glycosyltransferase family 2 protein n=2 Tax=Alcaligenes xylosoxydans xylosoxydans TaxID=85698 RepID=UPI0006AC6DEA|nr:glycosyltransferase family 2 protein [Achromobacter xylosoxidans]KOQ17810.1 glycosyl transferase family 2 [Achromobacter xylosoxidans]KOQ30183.1 glycosyl transferase family 2 [Achromobacter xylosoxidans]KOQ35063.1 glycosyl transferase family 2 [Achromobacter xylosoxidans]KOQ43047.1 glycosyl transferase family 2 [Achromobacter xylosoxidans]KOQ50905.1 glycosyl transferase family 2 [Achromobacter xylosoxidans]
MRPYPDLPTLPRTPPRPVQVSIIIPFLNEREVLPLCHARLRQVLDALGDPWEIVFVDDGSQDGSAEYLAGLMAREPGLKLVRLSRNFGKEAAMTAGLEHATGAAVILLDADLQDPPELIPDMVRAWREGADVVCMRRRSRAGESWLKRASAYAYYRLLSRLSRAAIPPDTGDFRLMSRRAVDALLRLPERCRYMKGLYAWIGMPTRVIDYDRAPRAAGATKWNYFALLRLAMEGITSFSTAPLRWATAAGVTAALLGALFGLVIIFKTLIFGDPVEGYPSLMAMITFLSGIQLITIGLLGEYMGKIYMEAKQRPVYLVSEVQHSAAAVLPLADTGKGPHAVNF